uniref:ATP synthase F0 subunit 8 n=1 Tax=Latreutes anoplonyx TaxID=3061097 RepID=UPI00286A0DAE|nr:ATP synthase F0 subunit 8 [Latreutes anoplonyx]WKF54303.1 ATP synthase F0 subunit 8 [Latreutes anoplonyx]
MPQMAPMLWLYLYMFMFIIFLIFISFNFFNLFFEKDLKSDEIFKFSHKNMTWKW